MHGAVWWLAVICYWLTKVIPKGGEFEMVLGRGAPKPAKCSRLFSSRDFDWNLPDRVVPFLHSRLDEIGWCMEVIYVAVRRVQELE